MVWVSLQHIGGRGGAFREVVSFRSFVRACVRAAAAAAEDHVHWPWRGHFFTTAPAAPRFVAVAFCGLF